MDLRRTPGHGRDNVVRDFFLRTVHLSKNDKIVARDRSAGGGSWNVWKPAPPPLNANGARRVQVWHKRFVYVLHNNCGAVPRAKNENDKSSTACLVRNNHANV